MKLAVRADASSEIGSGHVLRCLTLADRARQDGAEVHFVCRALRGDFRAAIEARGYRCTLLSAAESPQDADDPPIDVERDALETRRACGAVDWLVVDHYSLDARWHRELRPVAERILVLDDLADRNYDADLLLDQTLNRDPAAYRGRTGEGCRLLTGTRYALLRPEFRALRAAAEAERARTKDVRRVLVTMGGTDRHNRTRDAVDGLRRAADHERFRVTVVAGARYAHAETLTEPGGAFSEFEVLRDVPDMAELMLHTDVAIGAAGTTSWERCCLGLPTLTCVLADNQVDVARNLALANATLLWDAPAELSEALGRISDPAVYRSVSDGAFAVCDGLGTGRVWEAMRSC